MGSNPSTIVYNCGSKYVGQVLNNQPNGKGILHIHKNSSAFNNKLFIGSDQFTALQTEFQKGVLKRCTINMKNGIKFQGVLNQKFQFNGIGKMTDQQKVEYEGNFVNGKLMKGKIQSSKTSSQHQIAYICQTSGQYIGTSIISGPSTYYNITDKYLTIGDFHKGKISKGYFIFSNGDQYEGQFSQGYPNGSGTYKTGKYTTLKSPSESNKITSNQIVKEFIKDLPASSNQNELAFSLTCPFEGGNPSGKGQISFSNDSNYKGRFKDGQFHGYGEYKFSDGTIYKGNFYCGSMNGDCTIQFNQNSKINKNKQKYEILQKYQGQVCDGIVHGLGTLYYTNGVIFKGYFMDGAKNGFGVLIYCQNKYKCLYIMNKLIGQLKPITDQ